MDAGSVECTSCEFFLRLFRNYVYHFIFQKLITGPVGIKDGGRVENFSKIDELKGRLFGT